MWAGVTPLVQAEYLLGCWEVANLGVDGVVVQA
jgi:hypothetical protein